MSEHKRSLKPHPKVTSAAFAAAVTTIVLWAIVTYVPGVEDLPRQVQSAALIVITTVVTFLAGWRRSGP